ncbi:MAG: Uma2 family endonuclease [Candidatus Omnitrophota bacterium]
MAGPFTISTPIQFTYEDYLHFSDEKRYEIIEGEVYMVPSPLIYHQRVSRNLMRLIEDFVLEKNLGEVYYAPLDVVLSDINVVQPDILFVSIENAGIITDKNIQGAPDLVIEILSLSSDHKDKVLKRNLYAKFGVKEYWLVDPDAKQIQVFTLKDGALAPWNAYRLDETMQSALWPDLKLELKSIFGR